VLQHGLSLGPSSPLKNESASQVLVHVLCESMRQVKVGRVFKTFYIKNYIFAPHMCDGFGPDQIRHG
jgi:hypothetical protein